jgi:hypothetical protein
MSSSPMLAYAQPPVALPAMPPAASDMASQKSQLRQLALDNAFLALQVENYALSQLTQSVQDSAINTFGQGRVGAERYASIAAKAAGTAQKNLGTALDQLA